MPLIVPELSLVLLMGASGAGKSSFAARHFAATEILSSDHYRGVVADDPSDQAASADAFEVLELVARKRLARGRLTVIDATNVEAAHRKRWVRLAKEHHALLVAIVLDLPPKVCAARNRQRPDRAFDDHVIRRQASALGRSLRELRREGFRYVHHLRSVEAIDAATIERPRPWTDRRDDSGPFDIIGDVHGCFDELSSLLDALGHTVTRQGEPPDHRYVATLAEGRRLLFLGDLVDRGPASNEVLRLAMDLVEAGSAIVLPGNHEAKLLKHLQGKQVRTDHGLDRTLEQLATEPEVFRERVATFIDGLVSHFVLDGGKLVVAHAGMREDLAGRASGYVRQFALYGDTTGEIDAFGLPVRHPWAREYQGRASVVYGHTPVPSAEWLNNTICIDTGCVFGGELTALRWPERELVSVPAREVYCEPVRPLAPPAPADGERDTLLHLDGLIGGGAVETRFGRTVPIRPESAVAALEALSRFAVDPRWLVYLPPTMSPSETSTRPDQLEHPDEAFAYFRDRGIEEVVCEEKHMGSRAVVIAGRSPEAVARRFGFRADEVDSAGIVLTRRGRRFFEPEIERALLARVRDALSAAGTWEALQTDWVLLDTELMPWSAKASALVDAQYAPVGTAAQAALESAVAVLERATARGQGTEALLDRLRQRREAASAYAVAYQRYCWEVSGIDDYRLAPFHLLASEGAVHADKPHRWHLDQLERLTEPGAPLLTATPHRFVRLDDPHAVADAVAWWEALTAQGGEGMVVKPADFLCTRKRSLVQPALKCRGREYLRIIYGPEYTLPERMERLRQRATARKRSLAEREFLLGLEALHRFVEGRSLHHVHEAIFAILALEAEPVDPRL